VKYAASFGSPGRHRMFLVCGALAAAFLLLVVAPASADAHLLSVSKSGAGTGKVTSAPVGIDCGADCSEDYAGGTAVTLTATADPGSIFAGWSGGGCSGTGTCKVTVNAATTVTASFAIARTLTVTKTGTGTGTVTSEPTGIACGGLCSKAFAQGTVVTLIAKATGESTFIGWSGGGCSGAAEKCEVTLNADTAVTATFTHNWKLTAILAGNGLGTVSTDLFGVNCTEGATDCGIDCGKDCSETYLDGTIVTLTGTEDAVSSKPVAWSGCTNVTVSNQCEVTMAAAKSVTATFTLQIRSLSVSVGGTGVGTVTSEPLGDIECDITNAPDCAEEYDHGQKLVLVATPSDVNTQPALWSGCTNVAAFNRCEVTMNGAQSVTATFNLSPRHLAVTVVGSGAATVTSSPAGITCNENNAPDCDQGYAHGTAVTLTATEAINAEPAKWSGCDNVTVSNQCEVTMDRAKSVTATVTRIDKVISPRIPDACEDGLDNDGDGRTDYPADPGCQSAADDESGDPSGPKPQPNFLRPAGLASVHGGTAAISARCIGSERCTGSAELFVRSGGGGKVLIGRGSYDVAAGEAGTVSLRLNHRGQMLLDRAVRGSLKAILAGPGLRDRVVRLKAVGSAREGGGR
jgi:Divergent InlB B-repeat domain